MALRVAVIGSSGPIAPEVEQQAHAVGFHLARKGAILFTGGRDGVMAAASRGAREGGGLVVGILPGDDPGQGNGYLDVAVNTGLDVEQRSIILIRSADAVVMLGGHNGTLLELSLAYYATRPIVALPQSGGWAARIKSAGLEDGRYLDVRRNVEIVYADTPEDAAERAVALAEEFRRRRTK